MSETELDGPPDDKRMTLSEHLEELRARLTRAVIALGVALLVTMSFQDAIMRVVIWPHTRAMEDVIREKKVRILGADGREVEGRLKPGTVTVIRPDGREVEGVRVSEGGKLVALGYPETFFVFFKVSLIAAAAIASPFILFQLWRFISVGLYPKERRLVYIYAPLSIGLFLAGIAFGFFVLIPFSLRFLALFGLDLIDPMFNLGQYLNLLFFFTLALGVIFELPLGMHFAARLGLLDAAVFAKKRRLAMVLIVVAAAILTPTGDPYTLLLVSGPMYLLYELGILFCRVAPKPAEPAGPAAAGAA